MNARTPTHRQPRPHSFGLLAAYLTWLGSALACGDLGPSEPDARPRGRLSGTVRVGDPNGTSFVRGATVAIVPASAVATASTSISPLEDLSNWSVLRSLTSASGDFEVEVPAGRYFTFVLAEDDSPFWPGGEGSSRSVFVDPSETVSVSLTVAGRTSTSATFVGSKVCLGCHIKLDSIRTTRHFVGVRVPGRSDALQDTSRLLSVPPGLGFATVTDGDGDGQNDFEQGLTLVLDGQLIQLGFLPAAGTSKLTEGAELWMRLGTKTFPIALTYGGGFGNGEQRFVCRVDAFGRPMWRVEPGEPTHFVLPLAYVEGAPAGARWELRDLDSWKRPTGFAAPPASESFDVKCAGCHMTVVGFEGERALLAHEPEGGYDFDADGTSDQTVVGCESCHGPGSIHTALGGGFEGIVNPARLGPAARTLICGQCHLGGQGSYKPRSDAAIAWPAKADDERLERFAPGMGPKELFGLPSGESVLPRFGVGENGYYQVPDLSSDPGSYRDASAGFGSRFDHLRVSRRQYADFVRSAMYRNSTELLSCSSCHAPHGSSFPGQTKLDATDNSLCTSCHMGEYVTRGGLTASPSDRAASDRALLSHMATATFGLVGASMNAPDSKIEATSAELPRGRCITCHMPKTARSARWVVDQDGYVIEGDIRSHLFDAPSPAVAERMADAGLDPTPSGCVFCHRGPAKIDTKYPDFRSGGTR
ncbi:MAG: hypothetical protein HY791_00895 [Deltaproteobacteria bacterium]|nr:hypothetical protein [Deltaproteobacteria bacterium]